MREGLGLISDNWFHRTTGLSRSTDPGIASERSAYDAWASMSRLWNSSSGNSQQMVQVGEQRVEGI